MSKPFSASTPAGRVALCGMLTALMLALGYLESRFVLLPAVPGVKLGLSNAVLLYAVYWLPAPIALGLMLVKVALSMLLFASPASLLFSLAGGLLSVSGMLLLKRARFFGVVGVSVAGAVLHNAGQVLVAVWLLGTAQLWYYLAVLTIAAVATGTLTGVVATLVMRALRVGR